MKGLAIIMARKNAIPKHEKIRIACRTASVIGKGKFILAYLHNKPFYCNLKIWLQTIRHSSLYRYLIKLPRALSFSLKFSSFRNEILLCK